MPQTPPPSLSRRHSWMAPLAVLLLAVGAYANSLDHGFVCDDYPQIVENPSIESVGNIPRLLISPYWTNGADADDRLYRPVTVVTFALDRALGGGKARTFHLTNLLLHALASLAVYFALRTALRGEAASRAGPALAAMLFAVHPIHTDAVDSIVQRSELLATFGVLVSLSAAWRAEAGSTARRYGWLALSGAALAFALGSKETAAVLPLLWLVYDLAQPPPAAGGPRRSTKYIVAAGVIASCLAIRFFVLGGVASTRAAFGEADAATRLRTMIGVLGDYLRLLVWPHPLRVHYAVNADPNALCQSWTDARVLAGLAILAMAAGLAVLAWRANREAAAWLLWVPLGLLPVANLIPIGTIEAERFCYLPSVGLCAAVGLAFAALAGRAALRWPLTAFAALIVVAGFAATWRRNAVWADDAAFSESAVSASPEDPWGWWYRGACRVESGRPEDGLADYSKALEIQPDFPDVLERRGLLLLDLGRPAEAASDFRRILGLMPGEWVIRNNLALALARQGGDGNLRQAIAEYTHVIEIDGHRAPELFRNRAQAWKRLSAWREAASDFRSCLDLAPDDGKACAELARCEAALGNAAEVERLLARLEQSGQMPSPEFRGELERVLKNH